MTAGFGRTDRQIMEQSHRWYGGFVPWRTVCPHPTITAGHRPPWRSGPPRCNPASEYYHSRELANRLTLAARYMLETQHSDGTISPGWTNFHSPPDTAFVVVGYAQAAHASGRRLGRAEGAAADMPLFLERTLPALITGGTPYAESSVGHLRGAGLLE